jgi:hypothetical protein
MALDIDQTKFLEEAMRKVKEQAFYMKHAMVSLSLANELPAFCTLAGAASCVFMFGVWF